MWLCQQNLFFPLTEVQTFQAEKMAVKNKRSPKAGWPDRSLASRAELLDTDPKVALTDLGTLTFISGGNMLKLDCEGKNAPAQNFIIINPYYKTVASEWQKEPSITISLLPSSFVILSPPSPPPKRRNLHWFSLTHAFLRHA